MIGPDRGREPGPQSALGNKGQHVGRRQIWSSLEFMLVVMGMRLRFLL